MSNNPALYNAAAAGAAGGAANRWLTKKASSDYDAIAQQVLLFAAAVDAQIAATTISDGEANLMQSICSQVVASRWFPSTLVLANYTNIAQSVTAMWTRLKQNIEPIPPVEENPLTQLKWYDDFEVGGGGTVTTGQASLALGRTSWRVVAIGGSGTIQPSSLMAEANHPGYLTLTTNAAGANRAVYMYKGGNVGANLGFTLANQFKEVEFVIRLPNTTSVACLVGMSNNSRGLQTNQMALLFDSSSSPNWVFATSKGGVTLPSPTGVPPDTVNFQTFKIAQSDEDEVTLSINGVAVATNVGASIPTTEVLNYITGVETLIVGAKVLEFDYVGYESRTLVR